MWKKLVIIGVLVAAAAIVALVIFSERPNGANGKGVDRIILITIDTLRADHLSCYGYPRKTSPFLDELAANGALFTRAVAPMATTSPSHASILTGLYPIQHNVLRNGHILQPEYTTLAEVLTAHYDTAAVVSTTGHFEPGKMDQGFDFFNDPPKGHKGYRRAADTIDVAIEWLDQQSPDGRFFLWVHLFDPHHPYGPPAPYDQAFTAQTPEQADAIVDYLTHEQHVPVDFFDNGRAEMLELMDAYDGEILFADTEIRRLFEHVKAKGLDPGTVWVITADHGEGLGNHHHLMHGKNVYNEQIRVPLIVHFADGTARGQRIDDVVELTDVAPTILELGGADPAMPQQYRPLRAASLMPLLRPDGRTFPTKYAFAQRRHFDTIPKPSPDGTRKWGEPGEKYAIQNATHKYIYRTELDDELYDLAGDPYEMDNLIGRGLPQENDMQGIVVGMVEVFKRNQTVAPEDVDDETFEQLRSLGYVK